MNRVENLISDLCPEGVPVFSLGDIGTTVSGLRGKSKDDFSDGNAPYVSYVEIFNNPGIDFVPDKRVKVGSGENQSAIQLGDVLVTGSSETRNECGMTAVVTSNPEFPVYLNSFCFIWRPNKDVELDPQFAKHLFRGRAFRDRVIETANGVTRQNISKPKFLAIEIPLPPLVVQREVASILNKFIELEAELEAELKARKVQNSHYRDDLFSLSQRFESEQLRELCVIKTGKKDVNQGNPHGPFPFFTCSRAHTYSDSYSFDTEALLIAGNGEVGLVQYFEGKFEAYQRTYVLTDFRKVQGRYLFQYLKAYLVDHLSTLKQDGTISYIKLAMLADFMIPVPPVEIQNDFIAKFEKFEKLEFELGSELVARKSQYEYYRTKLLTFKEMDVA